MKRLMTMCWLPENTGTTLLQILSSSTDGNGSKDEANQANGSLETEEMFFPKKQENFNALEMATRCFEILMDIDQPPFYKIYELEKHIQNAKTEKQKTDRFL